MFKNRIGCLAAVLILGWGSPAQAEVYVAGQVGANIPQDLTNVRGVDSFDGIQVTDLDLKNQVVFGIKVGGYFPHSWDWLGVEGEFYHTDSDITQQTATLTGPIPTFSTSGMVFETDLAVNTFAFNLLARYPGQWIQPYTGVGVGVNVFSIDTPAGMSGTSVAPTLNLLAGVRMFVTDRVAAFVEYKHNRGTVEFSEIGIEGDYRVNLFMGGVSYHWK